MKSYAAIRFLLICMFPKPSDSLCASGKDVETLTSWRGKISSPGLLEGGYPNNQLCRWNIILPSALKIILTIENTDLQEPVNGSCSDYLQISTGNSTLVFTCGSRKTPQFVSTLETSVNVTFHSDENDEDNKGFRLTYTGICDGNISNSMVLFTPGYPNKPTWNMICLWFIEADQRIVMLQLEGLNKEIPACDQSPLELSNNTQQSRLCSSEEVLLQGQVKLKMTINNTIKRWIGKIHLTFRPPMKCGSTPSEPATMSNWSAEFKSPGFDSGLYDNNQRCIWVINIPSAAKIQITFKTFNLNSNENECDDYVEVTDSESVLFFDCGYITTPFQVTSLENQIQVVFYSDYENTSIGFNAVYEGLCGGVVENSVLLRTPNYPSAPQSNTVCRWFVGSEFHVSIIAVVNETLSPLPSCNMNTAVVYSEFESRNYTDSLCSSNMAVIRRQALILIYNFVQPTTIKDKTVGNWWGQFNVTISPVLGYGHCENLCNSDICTVKVTAETNRYQCICKRKQKLVICDSQKLCTVEECFLDQPFCSTEATPSSGDKSITWNNTIVGQYDVSICPNDAVGESLRQCTGYTNSSKVGKWLNPDMSFCSVKGQTFWLQMINMTRCHGNKSNSLTTFIQAVDDFTSPIKSSPVGANVVLPGDFFIVASTLEQLLQQFQNVTKLGEKLAIQYIKNVLNIVDSLVGQQTFHYLKYTRKKLVLQMLERTISSAQRLVQNVLLKNLTSDALDSINSLKFENLELQIQEWTTAKEIIFDGVNVYIPPKQAELFFKQDFEKRLTFIKYYHISDIMQMWTGPQIIEGLDVVIWNLGLTLLLFEICFLFFWMSRLDKTVESVLCYFLLIPVHFSFTATCFWFCCLSIQIFLILIAWKGLCIGVMQILSWVVPIVFVAAIVATFQTSYTEPERCLMTRNILVTFAFPPTAVVAGVMMVMYFISGLLVAQLEVEDKVTVVVHLLVGIVVFALFYGAVLCALLSLYIERVVFRYLFTLLNSMTGIILFLFYGVSGVELKDELLTPLSKQQTTTKRDSKHNEEQEQEKKRVVGSPVVSRPYDTKPVISEVRNSTVTGAFVENSGAAVKAFPSKNQVTFREGSDSSSDSNSDLTINNDDFQNDSEDSRPRKSGIEKKNRSKPSNSDHFHTRRSSSLQNIHEDRVSASREGLRVSGASRASFSSRVLSPEVKFVKTATQLTEAEIKEKGSAVDP
ncbi:uncharacterized protein LOC106050871 isoform X3 [Biomphalaria glabrata]|uniref:Uncharacterized protein LOC106050871 isoform X3 n=1 Tax=Biomphalaria glabrata TaxID=6526 RepID=A0A9W3B678_BIOGL|nr:uncharacterized protein LOC106050871 isoform X3 [Biomphalaria glabrata]